MRKSNLILLLLLAAGCHEQAQKAPYGNVLLTAPDQWKAVYGDSIESQLAFNLADVRVAHNRTVVQLQPVINKILADHNAAVKKLETTLGDILNELEEHKQLLKPAGLQQVVEIDPNAVCLTPDVNEVPYDKPE